MMLHSVKELKTYVQEWTPLKNLQKSQILQQCFKNYENYENCKK